MHSSIIITTTGDYAIIIVNHQFLAVALTLRCVMSGLQEEFGFRPYEDIKGVERFAFNSSDIG